MATYTPPPYFPQSSLTPADPKRYRKFKLLMVLLGILAVILLGGAVIGLVYMVRWML